LNKVNRNNLMKLDFSNSWGSDLIHNILPENIYEINNLNFDGISSLHHDLPTDIKETELQTRLRRAGLNKESDSLGFPFFFSQKQCQRKAPPHAADFVNFIENHDKISLRNVPFVELGNLYCEAIDKFLQTPDLKRISRATLNKRERVTIIYDPVTRLFAAFENNPLYQKRFLITAFKFQKNGVSELKQTGNVGLSKEARNRMMNERGAKTQKKNERKQLIEGFMSHLSPSQKLGKKQVAEAQRNLNKKQNDPSLVFSPIEEEHMRRLQSFNEAKEKFFTEKGLADPLEQSTKSNNLKSGNSNFESEANSILPPTLDNDNSYPQE